MKLNKNSIHNVVLVVVAALFLASCSTSQKTSSVDTRVYTQGLVSISQTQASSTLCKKPMASPENRDLKEVTEFANSCVRVQNWKELDRVAEVIASRDVNSPWGAYFLSLSAEGQLNLQRALWMADSSLKRVDDIGLLHFQKGRLLWKMGEYGAALAQIKRAVQLDPSLTGAHSFLGQIFFRDQEFDQAGKHFLAVLSANPEDTIALVGLSECRFQDGDHRGGMELLERVVRAHPHQAEFLARQAAVYEMMFKNPTRALAVYKNLLDLSLKRQLQGKVPANLAQKISELEKVSTMNRSIAGKPDKAPEGKQ